jgi:CubicO group peptidase (beta-lactamase class C family)
MTTGRLLLCIALGTTACEPPASDPNAVAQPAATEDVPALQLPEHLDAQVDGYVAQWGRGWPAFRFHGEIGISVGGELLLERAYGFRDLAEQQRHGGEASFRIGTLSAHVAAATALALVNDGVIALDDRVDRWISDREVPHVLTVEHLLTHTSGLPSFTQDLAFAHLKHLPRTHDDLVRGFVRDPLEFEPGTDFAPSNSNSVLLALLIERATGSAYEDVARTRVLEPLGMTQTHWGSGPDVAVGLVFDEAEHLEPPEPVDPRAFGASGAWISTTRDLHRLYAGLWSDRFGGERARLRWLGDNQHETPYAFVETSIEGRAAYLWLGLIDGFNSAVLVVPDDALVVSVLGNSEVVPAQEVVADVARLAYGLPVAERIEPRAVPVPPAELERTAGAWIVTRTSEEMLLESVDPETFDMLKKIQTEREPDTATLALVIPEHGRKRMHPRSPGRWFFKDAPQSTARLERGQTPERDVLVLQRDGTELRYVRAPDTVAARG